MAKLWHAFTCNVHKLLVELGYGKNGTIHTQAIGDLSLITFYYLLQIGKYTMKGKANNMRQTKQMVQFKLEDVKFFNKNKLSTLVYLPNNALAALVLTADSTMLKLNNQKNGWKGVCVHREANGEPFNCPVRALAQQTLHL